MTLRPLYRARLLHLPLSLLIFYLLLPQRAQETFSTLCGRVTTMRRWNIVNRAAKQLSPSAEAFRYFVLGHGEAHLAGMFRREGV